MFECRAGRPDVHVRDGLLTAGVLLVLLLAPSQALAQQATDRSFEPRFAVGGGIQYGAPVCYDCSEPAQPGFRGGFEYRINEDWAFAVEGVYTPGYDVYSFEQDGVTYPSMTHDYFIFVDLKFRWQFSDLRHRPYVAIGASIRWHKDTGYRYEYFGQTRNWAVDPDNVQTYETEEVRGAALFGFGWAFKIGERVEVRPELDLYIGRWGYSTVGVTAWYKF